MRAVNLLTYDARVRTTRFPVIPKPSSGVVIGIVATFLILLLGASYLSASKAAADRGREVTAVRAEERTIVARIEGAKSEQALADREQRGASLTGALARRVAWDQVLRNVARVLPAQTSVISLTVHAPPVPGAATEASATGTEGLLLTGLAFTQPTVALVLDRLALLPELVDVQLQSSTKTKISNRAARQFIVVAGIRAEGAPR